MKWNIMVMLRILILLLLLVAATFQSLNAQALNQSNIDDTQAKEFTRALNSVFSDMKDHLTDAEKTLLDGYTVGSDNLFGATERLEVYRTYRVFPTAFADQSEKRIIFGLGLKEALEQINYTLAHDMFSAQAAQKGMPCPVHNNIIPTRTSDGLSDEGTLTLDYYSRIIRGLRRDRGSMMERPDGYWEVRQLKNKPIYQIKNDSSVAPKLLELIEFLMIQDVVDSVVILSHEIGHVVLGHQHNAANTSQLLQEQEKSADAFAYKLALHYLIDAGLSEEMARVHVAFSLLSYSFLEGFRHEAQATTHDLNTATHPSAAQRLTQFLDTYEIPTNFSEHLTSYATMWKKSFSNETRAPTE